MTFCNSHSTRRGTPDPTEADLDVSCRQRIRFGLGMGLVLGLMLVSGVTSLSSRCEAQEAGASTSGQSAQRLTIERTVMRSGYDGKFCWVHARAGRIPPNPSQSVPTVILTSQKLQLTGSDVFFELHSSVSRDAGQTWSELTPQPRFKRQTADNGAELTVCDFTPQWHAATGKLLGIGQTVWYDDNRVMRVRPRSSAYSVYDPTTNQWGEWRTVAMPDEPRFANCGAGSVQRFDLPNGDVLLPVYFKEPADKQFSVTVCRCRFDGERLTYLEHGSELTVDIKRGLYEPSLTRFGDRFYLTLRNDDRAYVAVSSDGLNFDAPQPWLFDDGDELGSYNTQQHWVRHSSGLYLVYTRKGANNDHVFRHRAPLFIAQVDPQRLVVLRDTEQILVPERGARLGNFGVTSISSDEVWITVTEWMQTWSPDIVIRPDNKYGADNSIHVVKLKWHSPDDLNP